MWPKLSNINKDIHDKITNRNNLEASKLNCWVRLFSGVGDGLIMVSNPDTQLFAAAGEGGIYGFAGAGKEAGFSGTLGSTWGKIEAGEFKPGAHLSPEGGRSLRPSPLVTSLEFSEGEDQISRSGKISLKVFSLEQMELIQEYFMEPGYNLFIEWGWNTPEGVSGLIKTDDPNKIPSLASSGNLNQNQIRKKGIDSTGDYDNFLGFIVGGGVGNDGENFTVEIELRGTPELPTYLQSQNPALKVTYITGEGAEGTFAKVTSKEGSLPYGEGVLTGTEGANPEDVARDRRFATMFNSLPSHRQTSDIIAMKNKFDLYDFVNCDGLISENIDNYIQGSFFANLWKMLKGNASDSVKIQQFQIEKEKLFSKKKYIRFERALDIIGGSGLTSYTMGDQKLQCSIDISDTKIGAFPLIFSTKPESLLIPGLLPDFEQYYLQSTKPDYKLVTKSPVKNWIGPYAFVTGASTTAGHKENKNFWGYLKNLYINEDMMVNSMTSKNKNIREILYDILNEISSAVNSFWDFQIVEGTDSAGNIVLTVVDRNWVGQSPGTPKEFYHNGDKSRFLNSSLTIDIPGEMANQIISQRLGAITKTDGATVETGTGRFFAKAADRFMKGLTINNSETSPSEDTSPDLSKVSGKNKQKALNDAEIKALRAEYRVMTKSEDYPDGYYLRPSDYKSSKSRTEDMEKTVVGRKSLKGQAMAQKLLELEEENEKLDKEVIEAQETTINSNTSNLDIVPNPAVIESIEGKLDDGVLTQEDTTDEATFSENFRIYTFRDTNLFNIIKNNKLLGQNKGKLSHPLPIKYSFTILGTSGIRRGDMFNIVGIPEKYRKHGLFQVNSVEHSIEGMKWETTIEGLYRQVQ